MMQTVFQEIENIITFSKVYDNDSLDGVDTSLLLFYLRLDNGDYRNLTCDMVNISDSSESKKVVFNSTTGDEHICINDDSLLIQHTKTGISKPYQQIIQNFLREKPVQAESGLWGFIDKDANEIIACQFEDWNFFDGDFCVIGDNNNRNILINLSGETLVEADTIKHHQGDLFFVNKDEKWAVYRGGDLYIDFCEINSDEESFLVDAIKQKMQELHEQKYKLSLKEYVALFNPFKSERHLRNAGLWGQKVRLKNGDIGYIGWSYPASASLYDMQLELPVDNIGIRLDELVLVIK